MADSPSLPACVSIILPVRNEANYIQRSLEAVLHQNYPPHLMEVLITDGMSDDGTREIIQGYLQTNPHLKLVDNPGKIVPTGMNAALRVAQGESIIRVDGHCIIATDYIQRCIDHLQSDGIDGIGGPMETIGETPLSEAIALCMSSVFGVGGSTFRTFKGNKLNVDSIPFPAYSRKIIEKVGLYDEELVRNQDDEYNYRIRETGGLLLLADDVRSKYYTRGNFKNLWKQYFQYGYWKVRVMQKHPRQMKVRQFIPPVFITALILSIVSFPLFSWGWMPFAFVGGSYLLANLTVSFITAARKGWKYMPLLPPTFAILHVGYGLGFLVGLVKFANRWGDKVGKTPSF